MNLAVLCVIKWIFHNIIAFAYRTRVVSNITQDKTVSLFMLWE